MSDKAVDKFFTFLEERKLTKLNPAAFTQSEILTYADQNDFHFTREALHNKMKRIQESSDEKLTIVEMTWKNTM